MHRPGGVPDAVEQVKHGALLILAQFHNIGHAIRGTHEPDLRQYTQVGEGASKVIATQTGGRVFTSDTDLRDAIASCIADANAYYILTLPAARADYTNEYYSLQVTVDKPGVTTRTRTGYYAQP
jgi:hypothetical protein